MGCGIKSKNRNVRRTLIVDDHLCWHYVHYVPANMEWSRNQRSLYKGRLFLVPVSPPVHFEGVENRHFFSGRAILWTAPFWAGGFVNSMGVWPSTCTAIRCGWARCTFYVLCTSIHQHIETTVVCAAFVTWMGVLLFMSKGSHFAGIHIAYSYRKRQRNLTAHHYRTFFWCPPARSFWRPWVDGNQKKASLTTKWCCVFENFHL